MFSKRFSLTAAGKKLLVKGSTLLSAEQRNLLALVDSARAPEQYALQLQKSEQWINLQLDNFATTGWIEPRASVKKVARVTTHPATPVGSAGFSSFFSSELPTSHSNFADTDFHIRREEPLIPIEPDIPNNWFDRYGKARDLMMNFMLQHMTELGPTALAREIERAGASERLLSLFPHYKTFIFSANLPFGQTHLSEIGRLLNMPSQGT